MDPLYDPFALRSTAAKRDSLAAELDRDPQLSTARRKQRTQAFTSNMAHANLERQLVAAQTAKMELETKLREKDLLVERLERDRRWFADREKEEREEKEHERTAHDDEKRTADADVRALRTSLSLLREEHADLLDAHAALSRTTTHTRAAQAAEIATLTHRATLLADELAQATDTAAARATIVSELQARLDELSTAQEGAARAGAEEQNMSLVREELHRQAGYLRALEAANAKMGAELATLRERHASVEVLREEKRGLERKVVVLEEMREKVVRLEAEVEAGRREREAWANGAAEPSTPSKTPVSVTRSLAELRLAHARLLEEHGASTALLRRREVEVAGFESREAAAREASLALETEVHHLKEKAERKEHLAALAEREVGFLQALVASYSAEESSQESVQTDDRASQRLRELEMLLEEHKSVNARLSRELDARGGASLTSPSGVGLNTQAAPAEAEQADLEMLETRKALATATAEATQHLAEIERLEQALFELGGEIGAGRHVPPGTRVLSLRDNPEQQWVDLRQAAMDRLRGENEALLRRLKELEESGAAGGVDAGPGTAEELVPRASWELINREKGELEDLVKQKEKRLLRLQQVFTSKSAEFRDAIASILGLKLAFYPNGQIRVTSVYDLCASFVFQPTAAGAAAAGDGARMQLIAQGEGGPEDLPNLMHYWVEKEQCIPGFLASVTLECYDNSKRQGTGG